jgi:hypothetical protein
MTSAEAGTASEAGMASSALAAAAVDESNTGLRFICRDPVYGEDPVHGGWWPRSTDLIDELEPLLKSLLASGYEVSRVMYGMRGWDTAPRQMILDGRPIRLVGYYSQQSTSIILMDRSGVRHLDLLVVAADTPAAVAEHALALAGQDGSQHRLAEIMELAAAQV